MWILLAALGMVVLWGLRLKWRLAGFFGWLSFCGAVLVLADQVAPRPPQPPTTDYLKHHTPIAYGFVSFTMDEKRVAVVTLENPTDVPAYNVNFCAVPPDINGPIPCKFAPIVYPTSQQVRPPADNVIVLPARDGLYAVKVDTPNGSFDTWATVRLTPYAYTYEVWRRQPYEKVVDMNHSYYDMK
jgi:hypothetical protein